ncbi:MAG: hypothetical protein KC503_37650 [Myxococcales bacterium]|nr:hypothetical protein [Myxococcales bacterium]
MATTKTDKIKLYALLACVGLLFLTFIVFVFFSPAPLFGMRRIVLYFLLAVGGAGFLSGVLSSQAKLQGTWSGLAVSFTGGAAVAIGLLLFLPRLEGDYPVGVTYQIRSDSDKQLPRALEAQHGSDTIGKRCDLHLERVAPKGRLSHYVLWVLFPARESDCRVYLKSLTATKSLTLKRADLYANETTVLLPSGKKQK